MNRIQPARVCLAAGAMMLLACGGSTEVQPPPAPVPASLQVADGDGQTGAVGAALPKAVSVRVLDKAGSPVPNAVVAFAVASGGGTVSAAADTSDASGIVSTAWTLGTTSGAPQALTATLSAAGTSVAPLTLSATATPGAPAALSTTLSPTTLAVGSRVPSAVVAVRDRFGNQVLQSGVTVTVRLDSLPSTTLSGTTSAATNAAGQAAFTDLSIGGKNGTGAIVFEASGVTAARVPLTLTSAQAVRIDSVGSTSVSADAQSTGPTLSVRVVDAYGNGVFQVPVSFTYFSGAVVGTTTTGPDGVASLTGWTAPGVGNYQIFAAASGVQLPLRLNLAVHAAPPAKLVAVTTNPAKAVVGSGVVLGVQALDAKGNVVPQYQLHYAASDGTSGDVFTSDSGVAVAEFRVDSIVGHPSQVIFTAGTTTTATVSVAGIAGPFNRLARQYDSLTAPANTDVTLTFTSVDRFGNFVPGINIVPLGFGRPIVPSEVTTDSAGVGHFTATLDAYAGLQEFGMAVDTAPSRALALRRVFATADVGALRLDTPVCSIGATSAAIHGSLWFASGQPAVGTTLVAAVAAGNGTVNDLGSNSGSSVALLVQPDGTFSGGWQLPAAAGTYRATVTAPAGYALSPATYVCTK